ncbi:KOW domain-containing RNA-binding protein [Anaerosphaera multitolerans]|uniref:KOW domain-containing protein n=1 Tax=Anaerosphaera multitolerans TaxID=2487351 RepID=A0A437S4Y2_9FIRM|nr:KOW domain-containing RNA-binding protein [Anaerosphaera multitolerans]RVU54071.1 KOW domain-containing protein [Anaerosphaera multitolerans]
MEKTFLIEVGQVVKAKAGRDIGGIFLVYKVLDESYVLIVDGKRRKLANPKKKKVKHLIIYKDRINLDVENLNDSYIRKALKPYN